MRHIPTALLLALAAAAPLQLVTAQERVSAQEPTPEPTTTIRFEGGSLSEFAEVLRQDGARSGKPVNILMPEAAETVVLPRLTLTSVSVGDTLRAVATILLPAVRMDVESFGPRLDALEIHAVALFPAPSQMSTQAPAPNQAPGSQPRKLLRVLSLATLTSSISHDDPTVITADTALTAIETGLSIDGGPEVEIRYHTDSRLLFVRGTPTQVGLVEDVIQRLELDQNGLRRMGARPRPGDRPTALQPVAPATEKKTNR